MKPYTDIEQSKKLAKILPIESADMWWAERYAGRVELNGRWNVEETPVYYPCLVKPSEGNYSQDIIKDIPCWSLAALLTILSGTATLIGTNGEVFWYCEYVDSNNKLYIGDSADNPIDTCYNLILKLDKLKVL